MAGARRGGLIIGGPLAPLAATLTAGVLGGALLGGTAGSLISCREIGVQNETHFMMNEFRKVYHPEGFVVSDMKGLFPEKQLIGHFRQQFSVLVSIEFRGQAIFKVVQ